MAKPSEPRLLVACCLLAPLPVFWTYRAAFAGEWEWHLGHDDGINFVNNRRIQALSFENLKWMWQDGVLIGVYEPVSWLIKGAVVSVAGLSTRSFLTLGVSLHALTTLLVFLLTRRLLQLARPLLPKGTTPNHLDEASLFGALAFGVHPLRVECVHWLSAQPYVYCGALACLAMLTHFTAHHHTTTYTSRRILLQAASPLLCHAFTCLAVLSKGAGLGLPLVLVLFRAYLYPASPSLPSAPSPPLPPSGKASPPAPSPSAPLSPSLPLLPRWYRCISLLLLTYTLYTAFPSPLLLPLLPPLLLLPSPLRSSLSWHALPLSSLLFTLSRSLRATTHQDSLYRPPSPYLPSSSLSLPHTLLKAAYAPCWYLTKTLLPTGHRWHYLLESSFPLLSPSLLLPVLLVLSLSTLLPLALLLSPSPHSSATQVEIRHGESQTQSPPQPTSTKEEGRVDVPSPCLRVCGVWWCGYMLLLLPTLGLVGHGPAHWAADRYSYLPSLLLSSPLSLLYLHLQALPLCPPSTAPTLQGQKSLRRIVRVVGVAWLAALSLQSSTIAAHWRTQESFWRYGASTQGGVLAHYNLGLLHQDKGNVTLATEAFHTALQHGQHAPSYVALGLLQERARDLKAAEQLYHKALQAHPHNVPANLHLGRLYEGRGSLTPALEHYRAALKMQPGNLFALLHLAMVYEARRQPSDAHDAEKYYRQALLADPENASVAFRWANLCMYYERRPRRAYRLLLRALELNPNLEAARQALDIVQAQLQDERLEDSMLDGIPGM